MITIEQPVIIPHGDTVRLEAAIFDEKLSKHYQIYFEVDRPYAPYLCHETADAFVLAALPSAVKSGQDMTVHANVSPKLLFNLSEAQIPYLSFSYGTEKIKVSADRSEVVLFHPTAFGTGCSLGVDSQATIFKLTSPSCPTEYRITHLAYFGACHLGISDQETMDALYHSALEEKKRFADEIGLPIVAVNTDLAELFRDTYVDFDIMAYHYNASCVLALQKLFGKFAMASSMSSRDSRYYSSVDSAFVPYLGTENTEIILSDSYLSRAEKTEFIARNPLSPRYLDVCIAVQQANWRESERDMSHLNVKTHRNCGECEKCMWTLLNLEVLGVLDQYADAFDLDNYRKISRLCLLRAIVSFKHDPFFRDIDRLLDRGHVKLSPLVKLLRKVSHRSEKLAMLYYKVYRKYYFHFKMRGCR